jgi:hypothetical protein
MSAWDQTEAHGNYHAMFVVDQITEALFRFYEIKKLFTDEFEKYRLNSRTIAVR